MNICPDEYVYYKLMNAVISEYPYTHMFVKNVFDDQTYQDIQHNLPDDNSFGSIMDSPRILSKKNSNSTYKDRFIIDMDDSSFASLPEKQRIFWISFSQWFLSSRMIEILSNKFSNHISKRFQNTKNKNISVRATGLITRDRTGFSIGPHTDTDQKILTLLFYLPKDDKQKHLGTSIYVHKDPAFKGVGGSHYKFDEFNKVRSVPFLPNSVFCFIKTDQSFHGIDLIEDQNIDRNLIIYNLKIV